MATKAPTGPVKVRVLTDCALGVANDVVELSPEEADAAKANGIADANPEAVAYALTLPQNAVAG